MVQIMACRLFGAKPLPEPMLTYCQLDHWERLPMEFESKYKFFIHENAFKAVVCERVAIFSRGRWIKKDYQLQLSYTYNNHWRNDYTKMCWPKYNFDMSLRLVWNSIKPCKMYELGSNIPNSLQYWLFTVIHNFAHWYIFTNHLTNMA